MAITKRGENTYLIRVYTGRDRITKKRFQINETVHGEREDAERREQIIKSRAKKGGMTRPSRMTVKQLLDLYLDSTRRHRNEISQHRRRRELDLYVLPFLGNVQITKIKTSDIQRLFDFLLDPKEEKVDD